MSVYAAKVDTTEYPAKEKHPVIFSTFDELKPGEVMELKNDHDPRPLYYQFMMEREGQFNWNYTEEGPTTWKVEIGKL
ncbi:DUF2249 domain-containing protein [Salibacterium aidingense]|uniref:DUF2249 domain-containing protein n=1 Tax=Salibacterium aidingense TaxID=384933 RepID=UPI0004197829|nr:DUF2249 domain-containing protein [Salibacterium aidingense]